MVAEREWALTDRRPDAPADRLQADAVPVGRPHLDRMLRMHRSDLADRGIEVF
jgi:hypothetical protein